MSTGRVHLRRHCQRGFTIMEMLVALGISSIALGLIVGGALSYRHIYSTDITRTRINGNLRSSMDIVSMNIRQAGENLLSSFPAVLLANGTSGQPDTLRLRRGLIPEVLTLCASASASSTTLQVSSASLSNSACVASNVAPVYQVFESVRAEEGGRLRVFIYDSSARQGEFLDYTGSSINSGQYRLSVSRTNRAYPQLTSSVYVIEEYKFSVNTADKKFVLEVDGYTASPQPVAFDVTNFQVNLRMEDGTTIQSLSESDARDWKDVRRISISLSGQGKFKKHVTNSSITSEYFPRNVLSYEG